MGSDAPSTVELAAVDSNSVRLRGAFSRASTLGQDQYPGPDSRADLDISLLHW